RRGRGRGQSVNGDGEGRGRGRRAGQSCLGRGCCSSWNRGGWQPIIPVVGLKRAHSEMSPPITPGSTQARLILIGTALLLTLGMGIRQSFGLFLTPITQDLAVTASDFTLALAIQNVVWGLSQAFVGALADRFGLRITMMAGAAIYVAGLGVMAAAQGALA